MGLQNRIREAFDQDTTLKLALGHGAVLGLEKNRRPWYSCIPNALKLKLKRQKVSRPIAAQVALDPSNPSQYYVAFKDGKASCAGPKNLKDAIRSQASPVDVICFAPDGGWCDFDNHTNQQLPATGCSCLDRQFLRIQTHSSCYRSTVRDTCLELLF